LTGTQDPVTVLTASSKPADSEGDELERAEGAAEDASEAPCMRLVFRTAHGEEREVKITRKPLGVDLKKEMPLRVRHVRPNTAASDVNVEAGWTFVAVNGENIEELAFADAFGKLRKAMAEVPLFEP